MPRLLQALVYLKENQAYWDIKVVQQMVAGMWDDRLGDTYDSEDSSDDEDLDL